MPESRPRPRFRPLPAMPCALLTALLAVAAPGTLHAQQFVVEDAAIVEFGACQLEGWHGETETRIEPACQWIRNLEVMVGAGLDVDDGFRVQEYTVELKSVVRDPDAGRVGVAVLGGVDITAAAGLDRGRLASVFAIVPATLSFGDDRLVLLGNLGWQMDREDDGDRHRLRWGARGDVRVPGLDDRLVLVGETFATDGDRPEFQAGIRVHAVPDRLLLDLSWGGHTAADADGRGWVFGFGWTPPPFR